MQLGRTRYRSRYSSCRSFRVPSRAGLTSSAPWSVFLQKAARSGECYSFTAVEPLAGYGVPQWFDLLKGPTDMTKHLQTG